MAPEVFLPARKTTGYTAACDLWSAGVVLYMLLGGEPPFWDESQPALVRKVLAGNYDLDSGAWTDVSDEAKDLVRKLLCKDPVKRLTAKQALLHPWILNGRREDAKKRERDVEGRIRATERERSEDAERERAAEERAQTNHDATRETARNRQHGNRHGTQEKHLGKAIEKMHSAKKQLSSKTLQDVPEDEPTG